MRAGECSAWLGILFKGPLQKSLETEGAPGQQRCVWIHSGRQPPALEPTNCMSASEQLAQGWWGRHTCLAATKGPRPGAQLLPGTASAISRSGPHQQDFIVMECFYGACGACAAAVMFSAARGQVH